MLVRTGKLIKQSCLSTILVTNQCKCKLCSFRKLFSISLSMVFTSLTKSRMVRLIYSVWSFVFSCTLIYRINSNLSCISNTKCKFITMYL